jgi:hypothetical protein
MGKEKRKTRTQNVEEREESKKKYKTVFMVFMSLI